jgi:hypothetical protein
MCSFFTLRSLSPDPVASNLHIFVQLPTPFWILFGAFLTPVDVFFRLPLLTLARCWYVLSEMSHIWLGNPQGIEVPNQALWNTGIELLNSGFCLAKILSYGIPACKPRLEWRCGGTEEYKLMLSLYKPWRRMREVDILLRSLMPWARDGAKWLASRHAAL